MEITQIMFQITTYISILSDAAFFFAGVVGISRDIQDSSDASKFPVKRWFFECGSALSHFSGLGGCTLTTMVGCIIGNWEVMEGTFSIQTPEQVTVAEADIHHRLETSCILSILCFVCTIGTR